MNKKENIQPDPNKCNQFTDECNKLRLENEILNNMELEENPTEFEYLYPTLNDPNFNIKIAKKQEFNDTKYDGHIYDVKEYANILSAMEFELSPHQAFVRNFMSFQTPYNSLLLYHGLGTGKTCTAIGVTEETRDYSKQMGISKRIIVVASPNVQDNFRLQLFNERNLKLVDGIWTIKGCIGNKLLKEINPTNMKGLSKDKLISQIKTLINASYSFMGYTQFANEINKIAGDDTVKSSIKIRNLQEEFNHRFIVIDEVHNIRISDDSETKDIAKNLMYLVSVCQNVRLLLLSATPMFNNYKEIIWLLNLMNMNDRRGVVNIKDIFDKDGHFKKNSNGNIGKELFIRKVTGYISYVRGEIPYTFPFRVYPNIFSPDNTFKSIEEYPKYQINCKLIPEDKKITKVQIFLTKIGEYQQLGYNYIIDQLRKNSKKNFEEIESFGYSDLQIPLESLNIVYPMEGLDALVSKIEPCKILNIEDNNPSITVLEDEEDDEFEINVEDILEEGPSASLTAFDVNQELELVDQPQLLSANANKPSKCNNIKDQIENLTEQLKKCEIQSITGGSSDSSDIYADVGKLTGSGGLQRIMNFVDSKSPLEKGSFEYKPQIKAQYGSIFSSDKIGQFSSKIKSICENIYNTKTENVSNGIILIYSSYIDGGIIPMALALEEMGFTRYGLNAKPLFKHPPTEVVDVRTMKPPSNKKDFLAAKYVMITGDVRLSPNNIAQVNAVTNTDNLNGEKIKVILISQAGSEGIDLKFIRQIHIMDPWYNMNRTEQITGRGVRNLSHKDLPFEHRNVEIFLHGTILNTAEEESADLYVYRVAELKAIKIGKVTRLLKQTAVDCIINHDQTQFTAENFKKIDANRHIKQILSTGLEIDNFEAGDIPNSATCDYMETCEYDCLPDEHIAESNINIDTYNETFMLINSDKIIQKIRSLMRIRYFYKKKDLFYYLNTPKTYPVAQIYAALSQMINDHTEYILDRYGRTGYLINIGDYYLFQPSELNYNNISIYDRSVPLDVKHEMVKFNIKSDIVRPVLLKDIELSEDKEKNKNKGKAVDTPGTKPPEKKILEDLRKNYDTARTTAKVERGEENWYKFCGVVISKMKNEGISIDVLQDFLIEHMIESLMYNEKIELLNYFNIDECSQDPQNDIFVFKIKQYLCNAIIRYNKLTGIVLFDGPSRKNNLKIFIKKNIWVPAEPEDIREIGLAINEKYKLKQNLNKYVGFMGFEDKNKYMIFKVKDTTKQRHTGSRCDQSGKKKTIALLNEIIGKEEYTKENTKGVIQEELCIRQEFILRNYERTKKDGKTWFLTTELAVINEF